MKKHFDIIEFVVIERLHPAVYAENESEAVKKMRNMSPPLFIELSKTCMIKEIKPTK